MHPEPVLRLPDIAAVYLSTRLGSTRNLSHNSFGQCKISRLTAKPRHLNGIPN
jgi:hypothetical protein